jgi:hypothetical protein
MKKMIDFTYFYKKKYTSTSAISVLDYDILISTFNRTDRVLDVFEAINAREKYIIVLPESEGDIFIPSKGTVPVPLSYADYTRLGKFLETLRIDNNIRLCIDISGFIIPHMLYVIRYLQKRKNVKCIDIIYTEPQKYADEENTQFSDYFHDVAQVWGYGGYPSPEVDNDLLIIASGYDNSRIVDVASKKKHVRNKIQLFGFPSMQADMFQENMLRAYKAESAVGNEGFKNLGLNLYAPANDPFVAAQIIKTYIDRESRKKRFSNIYLAPISTKTHALGMALYHLWENKKGDKPISVIYPICDRYFGETTEGISKIWKYDIEIP